MNHYIIVGIIGLVVALIIVITVTRLLSRSHFTPNLPPSFEHNPHVWIQYVMEGLDELPYHTARKAQHPGRDGTTFRRSL
jgi:hypothetical protein